VNLAGLATKTPQASPKLPPIAEKGDEMTNTPNPSAKDTMPNGRVRTISPTMAGAANWLSVPCVPLEAMAHQGTTTNVRTSKEIIIRLKNLRIGSPLSEAMEPCTMDSDRLMRSLTEAENAFAVFLAAGRY
jgi:hypothetical protein